jgi:hypothetical protein
LEVRIDEESKTATVLVPDKSLSLAIGKEGQNARLAARLTGWRIDIKSLSTALEAGESMQATEGTTVEATMLVHDPELASAAEEKRRVRADGTVVYQKVSFGPIPPAYVGKDVRVLATSQGLYIYDGEQLITSFRRGDAPPAAPARRQGPKAPPPEESAAPPIPPEILAALDESRAETRKVTANGSLTYQHARYGPLEEQAGRQVQVRSTPEYLAVYDNSELVAIFRREEEENGEK